MLEELGCLQTLRAFFRLTEADAGLIYTMLGHTPKPAVPTTLVLTCVLFPLLRQPACWSDTMSCEGYGSLKQSLSSLKVLYRLTESQNG